MPVFFISLKAGGVGLNLTAADTVILYDPWWNPAVEEQALDRAHRIGQAKPIFVYRLVAADPIEEKMDVLKDKSVRWPPASSTMTAARHSRRPSRISTCCSG
ncbi:MULTISPECIES: C-terminal helicase domain-containing protein [Rhizobium]|uniref:C-terminal helicase domain-containing protein n=1 Tax=Rhizobium rhododendri TaxID=2506430 RepID=A0ABY8IQU9_9HYPH|nr:C-terminal helicase domain-containing protein [Rhizobium rhododendri]WFS25845.1 C-terminal helicase domain-containing protein [Rhizobium rhododendri]